MNGVDADMLANYTTDGIQPEGNASGWVAVILILIQMACDYFFNGCNFSGDE